MTDNPLRADVRRVGPLVSVIDLHGELNSFSEAELTQAFNQALEDHVHSVILNFESMTYLNSLGIGMLVTLLIRARRQNKNLVAYGLSEHYRNLFDTTRISQVIAIYPNEETARAAAEPADLPERES